jgi:hypothetical protein
MIPHYDDDRDTLVSECETVVTVCHLAIIHIRFILKPHFIKSFCLYKEGSSSPRRVNFLGLLDCKDEGTTSL